MDFQDTIPVAFAQAAPSAPRPTPGSVAASASMGLSVVMDPAVYGARLSRGAAAMAEPSSSAAGGFFLWKTIGGLAIFAGIGAFFAALVSMCMMTPRSPREWAVGLTSTAMSSLGGGAYAILKLGLLQHAAGAADDASKLLVLASGIGIVFACGLPGWAIVRWIFTFIERRRDKDALEVLNEARAAAGKAIAP